ncbi:hypothetical protein ACVWWN_006257 [Mycobacterium sp. URHB0021]
MTLTDALEEIPHRYPHIDVGLTRTGGTALFAVAPMRTQGGRSARLWQSST